MRTAHFFGLIITLFVMSFSTFANAKDTYVCHVQFEPGASNKGDHGSILVYFYTETHCQGSYDSSKYLCSKGATSNVCVDYSPSEYQDSLSINTVFQSLHKAAIEGTKVNYNTYKCNGGKYWNCVSFLTFYGQ